MLESVVSESNREDVHYAALSVEDEVTYISSRYCFSSWQLLCDEQLFTDSPGDPQNESVEDRRMKSKQITYGLTPDFLSHTTGLSKVTNPDSASALFANGQKYL